MRAVLLGMFLLAAVVFPQIGNAQVYRFETPPPAVTAATDTWQLSGDPIFHAGHFYYPTGPTVFFDGRVMARVDTWFGVPLYEDTTLEPYSVVYVPVGGNLMRPYERLRERELAGTTGSRPPSFPVDLGAPYPDAGLPARDMLDALARSDRSAVRGADGGAAAAAASPEFAAHGAITIGPPDRVAAAAGGQQGLWIDFGSARWYSAGAAVLPDAARFEPAGDYRGFPVYRERGGSPDRIFVSTVAGGPLAPFERR